MAGRSWRRPANEGLLQMGLNEGGTSDADTLQQVTDPHCGLRRQLQLPLEQDARVELGERPPCRGRVPRPPRSSTCPGQAPDEGEGVGAESRHCPRRPQLAGSSLVRDLQAACLAATYLLLHYCASPQANYRSSASRDGRVCCLV